MIKKTDRILKAYTFLLRKETSNSSFSVDDLAKETGWKTSTVKTYINKQWKNFIIVTEKGGKLLCRGLAAISQDDFIKINSQKLKYSSTVHSDSENLLLKARQFSLLAIYTYNNPYAEFKTYGYIVNIIIAWTALFHAIFQKKQIDYFSKDKNGELIYIDGDIKAWELKTCINKYWKNNTPAKSNLEFLIKLRNKIEHRNLPLIDLKVAGHCQACLNNFESILVSEFGKEFALLANVSLALQLSRTYEQAQAIKEIQSGFSPIIEFMDSYEEQLPANFLQCPEYRVSYFLVQKISNHKTSTDITVEFIKPGSDKEAEVNHVLIKEKEKEKFKPKQIISLMHKEGYKKFSMHHHTQLWKNKDAKNKGDYGIQLSDGSWYWYSKWIDVVRGYCKEHGM